MGLIKYNMNKSQLINVIISITLILSVGLATGYTIGYYNAATSSFPDIKTIDDINPGISTVKLVEIKNGYLVGKISGPGARIAYSADGILDLGEDDSFKIPVGQINLKDFYYTEDIPDGTQFLASSRGKYYYSVLDGRAYTITPKNRIYFQSQKEAENKGYLPAK
jgi:hypothetical protein